MPVVSIELEKPHEANFGRVLPHFKRAACEPSTKSDTMHLCVQQMPLTEEAAANSIEAACSKFEAKMGQRAAKSIVIIFSAVHVKVADSEPFL